MSDLLILPSVSFETLGMVTLESLSLGVPVIGLKSGATPDLLRSINSHLVVKDKNPRSLAENILWYMDLKRRDKKIIKKRCLIFTKSEFSDKKFRENFKKIDQG